MGRLTRRTKDRLGRTGIAVGVRDVYRYSPHYEAMEKLAHYEDLEEQLMKSAEIDIDSMVGEFMHYYNLQKENRLIELPCAVRSRIYFILENGEIDSQLIDNVQTALFFKDINGDLIRGFYLTKEEAEAKLKELEGEHIADVRKMGRSKDG